MKPESQWYAVYTKPRWEKKTAELLTKRSIENYCPLNKVVRSWSDRKKTVLEPLFKSYVFIKADEKELHTIKQVDGVINFVYWLGKPAIVKHAEIEAIRSFLEEFQNVTVQHVDVNINDIVKIKRGPFMEEEGSVVDVKNKCVSVYLPSLGYTLLAEIEKVNVEVITKAELFHKSASLFYQRAI